MAHHEPQCPHCEHSHHEHQEEHETSLRSQLLRIAVTLLLLIVAVIIERSAHLAVWQLLFVYLVPYLLIGRETLGEALEGITHGNMFNEHLLMSIATIGALAIGFLPGADTQFPEAVVVMLLFQVGELFEGYAEGKSRQSIAHLMDIRPDVAHLETGDTKPEDVLPGQIVIIRPGEKIPLDGIIVDGTSSLSTVALTGESMPRDVAPGDEVLSGCVNLSGVLRVRTTKTFGNSTATKIIDLVEHAADHKSRSEAFITRFARIYTPVVVAAALALAVIPPALTSLVSHIPFTETFPTWLYRALLFLVVSCPCALVISVPLTFFAGIGGASRKGILIKGANYIDVLSRVRTIIFDKTGTLTHGQFAVTAVHNDRVECSRILHLAAHVEHYSTHPIAAALRDAFPEEATDGCHINDIEEIAGQGIRARVGNDLVYVGNAKMMQTAGVSWRECSHTGTIIHVAINGEYAGHIVINDRIKDDSASAIAHLSTLGIARTVMLTGDRHEVAQDVASQLGIGEYHADLMPDDKMSHVEQMMGEPHPGAIAFVGDGINDAPVLALADVGIAMGALGSDAAIEAADVVLMDDRPSKLPVALRIARRTLAIARQNIAFAIIVKLAVLLLAATGMATMWMAVFADVGVTILAVLNAMRALSDHAE